MKSLKSLIAATAALLVPGCRDSGGETGGNSPPRYSIEFCPPAKAQEIIRFFSLEQGKEYKIEDLVKHANHSGYYIDPSYFYSEREGICEGARPYLATHQVMIQTGWNRDRTILPTFVLLADEQQNVRFIHAVYVYRPRYIP